jgi:prepilin-type N-terminal cleavage/methylation domain-containing protein
MMRNALMHTKYRNLQPTTREASPASPRAFTLIELLVVIAVATALMGILLPVFQTLRLRRIEEAMPNNLKAIDLALHNYEEANSVVPNRWSDLMPELDGSFDLEGDTLLKDGYVFYLENTADGDVALAETTLTKTIKEPAAKKTRGKLQVVAEPYSEWFGSKTYFLDHRDGGIKSKDDPKLVAARQQGMLELQKEGTKQIVAATKELIAGTPDDETVVQFLKEFPDGLKQGAIDYVAGGDGKVTLDDVAALAGNEAEPPKDRLEELVRYWKAKTDYGKANETTDGSNGVEITTAGLSLPPKDTLTWDVFRQLVIDYVEEAGPQVALLAVADAAQQAEQKNPKAAQAQLDVLLKLIDTALFTDRILSVENAAELRQFVDFRLELLE